MYSVGSAFQTSVKRCRPRSTSHRSSPAPRRRGVHDRGQAGQPERKRYADAEAIEQPRQHVAARSSVPSQFSAEGGRMRLLGREVDGGAGVVVEREQRPVARLGKARWISGSSQSVPVSKSPPNTVSGGFERIGR